MWETDTQTHIYTDAADFMIKKVAPTIIMTKHRCLGDAFIAL